MKIKDLIKILEKEDPETLVLVDGYEGDYDTPKSIQIIEVFEMKDTAWYYGNYKLCPKEELLRIKAVYLPR
jgi:hypothetical protein